MLKTIAKFGFLTAILVSGLAASGTGAETQVNPNIVVRPGGGVSLEPKPIPDAKCLANPHSRACRSGPSAARPQPARPRPRPQPNRPRG